MAVSPTVGCIYYTTCYEGVRYAVYPPQGDIATKTVFDLSVNPVAQVTDQALLDAIQADDCDQAQTFWTYVAYDPNVHIAGEPPVGDGSETNPFEIPLPGDANPDSFSFIVNPDGSITINHTTTDGQTVTGTIPADDDRVLTKAVPGDTLPFDVTLADGTVLTAGTVLPANVCATYYVDGDGVYVPGGEQVFEPTDENHTPEIYIAGDTINHTVTLTDGTVLNPGDTVPAGVTIFLELDTDGNIVEQDEIYASQTGSDSLTTVVNPDGSTTYTHTTVDGQVQSWIVPRHTQTVKYVEGQTLAFDVLLPDGVTTLTAGDPVPNGVCLVVEQYVDDGSYIYHNGFEASGGVDTNNQTYLFNGDEGDVNTLTVPVTADDGTIYQPGDPIPAGTVIFVETDTDGNIIDVDKLVKNPTVKEVFLSAPIACEDVTHIIGYNSATQECGPVDPCELIPSHSLASCVATGETVTELGTGGDIPKIDTVRELTQPTYGGDWIPTLNSIPASDIPINMEVPAPTSADCLILVQVSYGAGDPNSAGNLGDAVAITTTGGLENEFYYGRESVWSDTAETHVFVYENSTATAGTISVDFPNKGTADYDGMYEVHVFEVCGENLTSSGLNLSTITATRTGTETYGDLVPASADFESDCDAVFLGIARHVYTPTSNNCYVQNPGDAAAYDFGAITAGTALPAGVHVIYCDDGNGNMHTYQVCDTNAGQTLYSPGDTLPYDIRLLDDSTLTAGTALPANYYVCANGTAAVDGFKVFFTDYANTGGAGFMYPVSTNWSQYTNTGAVGVQEAFDTSSGADPWFDANCQFGSSAGIVMAGNGPTTFNAVFNNTGTAVEGAKWIFLEPVGCDAPVSNNVLVENDCVVTHTNDNCLKSAVQCVTVQGTVCISAAAGNSYTVSPLVNGVVNPNVVITLDNSAGTTTQRICQPYNFTEIMPTVLAPGETAADVAVSWQVTPEVFSPDADNFVQINDFTIGSELKHV